MPVHCVKARSQNVERVVVEESANGGAGALGLELGVIVLLWLLEW